MPDSTVAILDIGSNSIKILVAARGADGGLHALKYRTIDARISAGISQAAPRLSDEGMARGLDAIQSLLADAAPFSPVRTVLVATSAVRDAANGPEFRERVRATTGQTIRILTGDEEAGLIGRGLTCDPALAALRDFYVFDLGGGSLECLAFRHREVQQAVSLQLGCVRLTEKFVPDPTAPFSPALVAQIAVHCADTFERSGFVFNLPSSATAVGTGGTVTTVRAILGARQGVAFDATPAEVGVDTLRTLLRELGGLPLAARQRVPGLPPARADVFPTALATLVAVAERGHFTSFRNSLFNLRYGLAAEALATL
jgi:exopolyphosphatase/guanosine-5'-triphosphate,3'-diphosphate pyrophosphatase